MEKFIVAFANDDGKTFVDRHFGDANYFDIYEFYPSELIYIRKIENITEEDSKEIHGDPKKAKGILELLKSYGVQILVSNMFGPNIKRIKTKFVCVLIKMDKITDSFNILQNNWQIISDEWEKGEERNYIDLRKL